MELEVLGDRYELQEPIGRGGMATIYRAVDLRMGRTVAVKILREVYSSDPKFVTRFQREARAASALQHPNIVQVFDYGQSGDSYYIVMEFVEGADLRRYIKKQGMLDNERAIEIGHDVALGLGAAHKRGIVHRDVKPQNVMLNDDGLVKLTDFGIASMYKDAEAERLTTTGMTLGTVQYYAPEQAQGEVVSPAADVYALGIVLYEMLAGRTPFDGDTPVAVAMRHIQDIPEPPSTFNPRISPGLERVIMRCLEKDPRDRYRDGDALAYALENLARSPRRATGVGNPASRPAFAPLGLPSTDARPMPNSGPAAYAGPALASGPQRGARPTSQPMDGRPRPGMEYSTEYDAYGGPPTYNDFDGPGGMSTRPHGPAAGTLPRTSGVFGPHDEQNGQRKSNAPMMAVIIGAAVLLLGLTCFLVLALSGAIGGLGTALGGSSPTPLPTVATVSLQDYTGQQFDVVQGQLSNLHLIVKQTPKADKSAKGTILSQDPAAGKSVQVGSTVTLTVSTGPDSVTIPDLTGKTQDYATGALSDLGLQYYVQYQQSSSMQSGFVISTDPPAGSPAAPNSKVTVYVSTGAPTPTVAAPTATPTVTATATPTKTPCATPTPSGPVPGSC